MAQESQDTPQDSSSSVALQSNETAKKKEPTEIVLMGVRIVVSPQESAIPLSNGSSSPSKKRSRTSMMQETTDEDSEANGSSHAEASQNPKLTCDPSLEEELTRKIKKLRDLREEKNQTGLSTLFTPTWTIKKALTTSDIGTHTRLTLGTKQAENHIMKYLPAVVQSTIQDGNDFKVKAYDEDTKTEHDLVLKRHKSSRTYVLNGGWAKDFVRRRNLEQGNVIGLFWNTVESRLRFCVIDRAPPAN